MFQVIDCSGALIVVMSTARVRIAEMRDIGWTLEMQHWSGACLAMDTLLASTNRDDCVRALFYLNRCILDGETADFYRMSNKELNGRAIEPRRK